MNLDKFELGIKLFNEGHFFDCHEVLEDFWKQESEPDRQLTQGIIQVAVAYYHLGRGNRMGALKLFKRGRQRILGFDKSSRGLDLAAFAAELNKVVLALEAEDEKALGSLCRPALKPALISDPNSEV